VVSARSGLASCLAALVVLLAALGATAGLGVPAWGVGLTCGVVTSAAVARGLDSGRLGTLGPADLVTLVRLAMACGIAGLVADSYLGRPAVGALVGLASVALLLDAVDGRVARRTGTASVFGARFDGEADAFLILVLSVYVAGVLGPWVLALGAARYAFALAGWVFAWMREPLPFRYWRKVVAAAQGVVLTFAAADVAPRPVTYAAVAVAAALLAESFGRDVMWLWRQRQAERRSTVARPQQMGLQLR
jgi:phosphatidylglycerophosphate synthase